MYTIKYIYMGTAHCYTMDMPSPNPVDPLARSSRIPPTLPEGLCGFVVQGPVQVRRSFPRPVGGSGSTASAVLVLMFCSDQPFLASSFFCFYFLDYYCNTTHYVCTALQSILMYTLQSILLYTLQWRQTPHNKPMLYCSGASS